MSGQNEQAFADILDAVYRLRKAFIKNGLQPPISIELGDPRDSTHFRYMLPKDMALAQPRMGDTEKDAEWVCSLMGIEVRMPGQWRSGPDGKLHFL